MSANLDHDSSLEAGLLRKQQEEEKTQLTGTRLGDVAHGRQDTCPEYKDKRSMSPLCRVLVVALVGLIALMGMTAAGPCFAGGHKAQLEKRQAPGSGTTTNPSGNQNQGTPVQGNPGNNGAIQTLDKTVTETVVTTTTVHQNPGGDPGTGLTSPGTLSTDTTTLTTTTTPSSSPATTSSRSSSSPSSSPTRTTSSTTSSSSSHSTSSPSSSAKPTSSSTETPPRKTITTGTITTSSEVQETVTTTDDQGGVFVTTLTSWVEVRPTPTGSADPSLQNAAPAGRGAGGVAAAAIAGVVAGVLAF